MLYSTFYLNENLMALSIPSILEIGRSFKVHPVRGASEVIDGLINLRGKVITIINTGLAFGGEKVKQSEDSRIFILKSNQELTEVSDENYNFRTSVDNIGIHVNKISEVIEVQNSELLPVPANAYHPYYKNVIRYDDHFISILEPERLLNLNENKELSS